MYALRSNVEGVEVNGNAYSSAATVRRVGEEVPWKNPKRDPRLWWKKPEAWPWSWNETRDQYEAKRKKAYQVR